jgi:hypothetical protein
MKDPNRPRLYWAEGVVCKNCGQIHLFSGYGNNNVPMKDLDDKIQVWCQKDGSWPEYDYDKEVIEQQINPPTTGVDAEFAMRIVEIENRLKTLELKTAELPEKDGIKRLKSEINKDFTGFLADALKKTDSGGATYG